MEASEPAAGSRGMMSLFEAAWVIARRDFIASVFSRTFILFLLAPMLLFGFAVFFGSRDRCAGSRRPAADGSRSSTDSATAAALATARERLVAGTSEQSFPILRSRRPGRACRGPGAGFARRRERRLFGGAQRHARPAGADRADQGRRLCRAPAAAARRRCAPHRRAERVPARRSPAAAIERVVTEQAAGNLAADPPRHGAGRRRP